MDDGGWVEPVANSTQGYQDEVVLGPGVAIYDTAVSLHFSYAGWNNSAVVVQIRQWWWGENETYTNGTNTSLPQPTMVPVEEDLQKEQYPITLPPRAAFDEVVPLPYATSWEVLEIDIDGAWFNGTHLSPSTAAVLGGITQGSQFIQFGGETLLTGAVLLVVAAVARGFAKRVHRMVPGYGLWWAATIGVPFLWWLNPSTYVDANQFMGSISPLVFPIWFGLVAAPLLPRAWTDAEHADVEGFDADADPPNGEGTSEGLWVVRYRKGTPKRAPATLWEMIKIGFLRAPLGDLPPDLVVLEDGARGEPAKIYPQLVAVRNGGQYPWSRQLYDLKLRIRSGTQLEYTLTRLSWHRAVTSTEERINPQTNDAEVRARSDHKLTWPHWEAGTSSVVWAATRSGMEYAAGITQVDKTARQVHARNMRIIELQTSEETLAAEESQEAFDSQQLARKASSEKMTRERMSRRIPVEIDRSTSVTEESVAKAFRGKGEWKPKPK